MTNRIRVFAGECTTEFEGTRDRTSRGIIVALVKPDNTVLVHDSDGYSPVAWFTRPASLTIDHSDGTTIEAYDGEQQLQIRFHEMYEKATYPGSVAGVPVGTCSSTGSALVRCRGSVVNVATGEEYDIPSGAVVLDEHCRDCGLPLIRVERGSRFEVCLDRRVNRSTAPLSVRSIARGRVPSAAMTCVFSSAVISSSGVIHSRTEIRQTDSTARRSLNFRTESSSGRVRVGFRYSRRRKDDPSLPALSNRVIC